MTSIPATYHAYRRTTGPSPQTIERVTEPTPTQLAPTAVLIRIRAVALNYRDVAMLHGAYPVPVIEGGVPASDCAGEVVKVGAGVTAVKVGDRVAPIFDLNAVEGSKEPNPRALGGDVDGVLRQFAVFEEKTLAPLPAYLSWEEASTVTCAGVTAWNALNLPHSANKGTTALLQGTGGVSSFALLLCLAANITPVLTSSSDAKLDAARALAGDRPMHTVNYKTHAAWGGEVQRLTQNRGADVVLENGGPATIEQSLAALARRGTISLIGFLGGMAPDAPEPKVLLPLLVKSGRLQSIYVGSWRDQVALGRFLEEHHVKLDKIIDGVFEFDEAEKAFERLWSGKHQGKIVIRV
ncbi:uncharacterized protein K452DRAFT_286328 [Aplosporella prunicola CBS 121167]|uniref:Enoyl reductase (ER) domain-containing protein n=1 Tax=Aplosporella prunicola CBS 121167 TaxID=1176127 RepID=A0A6A6BH75_9PEZI|nr:uncharacterized protein K452DRAFT_286328 [Aplosporella prunicola CBS 121167]KAF2143499.1 hypothetical protein K452DRAFT_286328 [Aplosporella prunicola CBS 121167]